jgi:peptide/nickel transport system permease protein
MRLRLILGKLIRLFSLLVAVCVFSFVLVSFSPIDPVRSYVGADMMRVSAEQKEQIAAYWGLDQPPLQRFLHWGNAILHGDLGTSMIYRVPVTQVIKERFYASALLMGAAWTLSGLLGLILGIIAGMHRGSLIDKAIKWYCLILASTPTFWIGLLLLIVFSVYLGWFPIGLGVPAGMLADQVSLGDRLYHMILPCLALSIIGIAAIALHTRQKTIDVMNSDYILFARAKGEKGYKLFFRHGLRNMIIPALTLQFASFSELFGGAVLAEQVFSYPGLGQATVQAGLRGDLPLLLGLVLISAVFVFTGNFIADLLYCLIDPRMKEVEQPA